MKIALIGGTCVGKTSVLQEITNRFTFETRFCGREVLSKANELGVDPENLSQDDHRLIDEETKNFAKKSRSPLLIDGRFLNYVLAGNSEDFFFVRLVGAIDIRAARALARLRDSNERAENFIAHSDMRDENFCRNMYCGVRPATIDLQIDTSELTVPEVARRILSHVS